MEIDHSEASAVWRKMAKREYSFYCLYVHKNLYIPARHTKLICDKLQEVEAGKLKRLIICLPPRHSKSMTVSETFPSFFIGRNPHRRVIEVSYGDTLAEKFGARNKEKIEEFGNEIFGINLNPEKSSKKNWEIKGYRGGMISAGIGAGVTGEGADLLVVDDPIKNRQEADSETYREMVWNEWQNTLLTRLQPGGAVIIILTRWHHDDLAGRLLASEPENWTVLSLCAEAEQDDPLGREIGEPLWPEIGYNAAWIEEKKKAVGTRVWTSLYQQKPSPEEGGLFKKHWFKYWHPKDKPQPPIRIRMANGEFIEVPSIDLPDRMDEYLQSWDMSFKDTETSDFTCGQVWARKAADKFLLDQYHKRADFPTALQGVVDMSKKWPQARRKLVEDKANGSAIIAALKHRISGLVPVLPEGGKLSRAHGISADVEAGNIFLPHPAVFPWVNDLLIEICSFPAGAHDDMVDSMTQGVTSLIGKTFSRKVDTEQPTGTWHVAELRMKGYKDYQIRRLMKKGEGIKVIGRLDKQ